MGLLSGLGDLGLSGLENMDIFDEEEKEEKKSPEKNKAISSGISEKDLIFEKKYDCPVCGSQFGAKIMKTGKAKALCSDKDLRPRYEGIDALKYDVLSCNVCGYSALGSYFPKILASQVSLIKEKVSMTVSIPEYHDEIYGYEQALERYKLALACAVVKRAKVSEKAYICLKSGWLVRGWLESIADEGDAFEVLRKQLTKQEDEYLLNAYKGFLEARKTENFPICGMDQNTLDYLLAVLSCRFGNYDAAARLVTGILTSTTVNNRIKEKARDLKNEILEVVRKK